MNLLALAAVYLLGIISFGICVDCGDRLHETKTHCHNVASEEIVVNDACSILGTNRLFHELAIDPDNPDLTFEHSGYLIGVEKGFTPKVGRPLYTRRGDKPSTDIKCKKGIENGRCFHTDALFYKKDDGMRKEIELYIDPESAFYIYHNSPFHHKALDDTVVSNSQDSSKQVFVSHIVKYSKPKKDSWQKKVLYNIYRKNEQERPLYCKEGQEKPKGCESTVQRNNCSALKDSNPSLLFNAGWDAMEEESKENGFKHDLKKQIKDHPPTHIILFAYGWNVTQMQAINRMNRFFGFLRSEAILDGQDDSTFKPLIIGLTWASKWPVPFIDVFNKGDDADEIGATVANILLNRVILPEIRNHNESGGKNQIKLVVIGHSLGARVLSQAIAGKPLLPLPVSLPIPLFNYNSDKPDPEVDLFIGFQPAFSINRFFKGHGLESSLYRNFHNLSSKTILTSSERDGVISFSSLVFPYAGSERAYFRTCGKTSDDGIAFKHFRVTDKKAAMQKCKEDEIQECRKAKTLKCREDVRQECVKLDMQICKETEMQKCTESPSKKCSLIPTHKCSEIPTRKCKEIPIQEYREIETDRCKEWIKTDRCERGIKKDSNIETDSCEKCHKSTTKITDKASAFGNINTISMVDATTIINKDTSIEAAFHHGSLYSPEMGRFVWKAIKGCETPKKLNQ